MTNLNLRAWYKKGYGEKMVYNLSPNTWGKRIPSNAESCMIFMLQIGSKDNKGNIVYDKDILKSPSGALFVVKWNEDEFAWKMYSNDGAWYNMNMGILERVGNIYENSDLIN